MNKFLIKLVITFAFLVSAQISSAANVYYNYAEGIGSTGADKAMSVFLDSSSNIYITGSFSDTVDFDPGAGTANLTSAGSTDIFILKLDSTGAFGWVKQIGGTGADDGNAITTDSSGNVYVGGRFYSTIDFDPGAGTTNLTAGSASDAFVLKLDSNGDYLWAKDMGGNSWNAAYSIAVHSTGVYTTGLFAGTTDFDPGAGTANLVAPGGQTWLDQSYVSKLDTDGNYLWAKSLGGSLWDTGESLAVDSTGAVYLTGYFESTADFDPGAGTANLTASSDDVYVLKLDVDGLYVWAKKLGGTSSDVGMNIAVDSSNNVYTTGYFNGTADFDPGAGTANLTSAGARDFFISKLDSNGDFAWVKQIGGTGNDQSTAGNALVVTSAGEVYAGGIFNDIVDFDPGAGTANLTSGGGSDSFVLKLDSSGDFVWTRGFSGSASDQLGGLYVNSSNEHIYTVGYFQTTADFDPDSGTQNLISEGGTDIFVSILSPDTTGPTFSSISASNIQNTSATISWTTNEESSSIVEYGLTSGYGSSTTESDTVTLVTSHSVSLSGLQPCTDYNYIVKSNDVESNLGTSSNNPFKTSGCGGGVVSVFVLQAMSEAIRAQENQNAPTAPAPIINTQVPVNTSVSTKFLTNLTYKSKSLDILELQKFLNANGYTVALTGAGSVGFETMYFGPATRRALIKFQRDNGIIPNGYFGPVTRRIINNS